MPKYKVEFTINDPKTGSIEVEADNSDQAKVFVETAFKNNLFHQLKPTEIKRNPYLVVDTVNGITTTRDDFLDKETKIKIAEKFHFPLNDRVYD